MPGLQESQLLGVVFKGLLAETLDGYGPGEKGPYIRPKINKYQNGHEKPKDEPEKVITMFNERDTKPGSDSSEEALRKSRGIQPGTHGTGALKSDPWEGVPKVEPQPRIIPDPEGGSPIGLTSSRQVVYPKPRMASEASIDGGISQASIATPVGGTARPEGRRDRKSSQGPKGPNSFVRAVAATALAVGGVFGLGKVAQTGALGEGPQDVANGIFDADTTVTSEPRPTQNVTEQPGGGVTVTQGGEEATISPATETAAPTDIATETAIPEGALSPESFTLPNQTETVVGKLGLLTIKEIPDEFIKPLTEGVIGGQTVAEYRELANDGSVVGVSGVLVGFGSDEQSSWMDVGIPALDSNRDGEYLTVVRSYLEASYNGMEYGIEEMGFTRIMRAGEQSSVVNNSSDLESRLTIGSPVFIVADNALPGYKSGMVLGGYAESKGMVRCTDPRAKEVGMCFVQQALLTVYK